MGMAINPTAVPSLTVGGRVFTDLDNLKILSCYGSGASPKSSARLPGQSSGYQVPVGKKFKIQAILISNMGASVANPLVYYQDNDSGWATATAPVNPVYMTSGNNVNAYIAGTNVVSGTTNSIAIPANFEIPAGKYIGCSTDGPIVYFYGYEVPA